MAMIKKRRGRPRSTAKYAELQKEPAFVIPPLKTYQVIFSQHSFNEKLNKEIKAINSTIVLAHEFSVRNDAEWNEEHKSLCVDFTKLDAQGNSYLSAIFSQVLFVIEMEIPQSSPPALSQTDDPLSSASSQTIQ